MGFFIRYVAVFILFYFSSKSVFGVKKDKNEGRVLNLPKVRGSIKKTKRAAPLS